MYGLKIFRHLLFTFILIDFSTLLFANNDQLKEAKILLDAGKTVEAIDIMKIVLAKTTELNRKAEIQGAIGWGFVKINDYLEAEKHLSLSLRQAIESNNEQAILRANNNLGITFFLQNRLEESKAYFNQAIAENSETSKNYLELIDIKEREILGEKALDSGVSNRRKKQFEEAIIQYDLSLKYLPQNAKALELKGYAQFRLGNFDDANKTLLLAKAANPNRKFVHLNLLKVSCALDTPNSVKQVIDSSGLEMNTYHEWWSSDGELKRVCADNEEFSKLMSYDVKPPNKKDN